MLAEVSDVSAARTKRTGKLVVVGDGPSLESFDFKRLAGVDTLAVKAAIRHLDRTDWRPTHYACLDDAFIDVHHDAIARLMAEGAVETAFLTGRYLDHHPEAVRDPRLVILGRLEAFEESVFFRSADPSRATGRANCVRYGALLGYDKIALIGFDLIPDPPGSRDHAIENASFNMLRDDFLREGVRSAVYNADPHSFLSTGAVLSYKSLAQFLGEPALSSVIVPATAGERAQILDNIWLWSQPAFFPLLGTASERAPLLVFIFNNDEAAKMQSEIEAALNASPLLGRCFSGVRYVNLQLTGDADRYERDNARIAGVEGRRAGPNNMFFGGLAAIADLPGHTLWLETDCVPLRADWLAGADDAIRASDGPWIAGSIYRGGDPLGQREMRHINGNAFYAAGAPDFRAFVDEVWKPQLKRAARFRPDLAFDCVIDALFESANPMRPTNPNWRLMQTLSTRIRYTEFIQNIVDQEPSLDEKADQLARILAEHPTTYVVHSRRAALYVSHLRKSGGPAEPLALIALMRSKPSSPGRTEEPAPVSAAMIAAEMTPTAVRRTFLSFLGWSARIAMRKPLRAGAAGFVAAAIIGLAALSGWPGVIIAAICLSVGAFAMLAFAYLTSAIAEESRLAEERTRQLVARLLGPAPPTPNAAPDSDAGALKP